MTNGNAPADISATMASARGVIAPRTSGWRMSNIRFHNFPSVMTVFETCSMCSSSLLFTNTGQEYEVEGISYNNVSGPYVEFVSLKR